LVGLGVVVMFITNYALVPGLTLAWMKHRKARPPFTSTRPDVMPKPVAWSLAVTLIGAGVAGGVLLWGLRYHNDFSEMRGDSDAQHRYDEVAAIMGGPLDPALVMVNDIAEARALSASVQARIDASDPWLGKVLSVASLVPDPAEIDTRRPIIERLRQRVRFVPDVLIPNALRFEFSMLKRVLAAEPWTLEDVPTSFRVRLQTDDQQNALVLIWPKIYVDNDDATAQWLASVDGALADAGLSSRPILDINRVINRMNALMLQDIPRLSVACALVMLALLAVHLRRPREVFGVFGALGLGVLLLVFVMRAASIHFNLLNVIVLPTVVGMGIDNAVHLLHTYRTLGPGSLRRVLHLVGRPAALASATTAIGFGSLSLAAHPGIRGVGVLSLIGISVMFLATTVLVLATLQLLDKPHPP
jgi:hypothetical protein